MRLFVQVLALLILINLTLIQAHYKKFGFRRGNCPAVSAEATCDKSSEPTVSCNQDTDCNRKKFKCCTDACGNKTCMKPRFRKPNVELFIKKEEEEIKNNEE